LRTARFLTWQDILLIGRTLYDVLKAAHRARQQWKSMDEWTKYNFRLGFGVTVSGLSILAPAILLSVVMTFFLHVPFSFQFFDMVNPNSMTICWLITSLSIYFVGRPVWGWLDRTIDLYPPSYICTAEGCTGSSWPYSAQEFKGKTHPLVCPRCGRTGTLQLRERTRKWLYYGVPRVGVYKFGSKR
jgi:hypothetical protein